MSVSSINSMPNPFLTGSSNNGISNGTPGTPANVRSAAPSAAPLPALAAEDTPPSSLVNLSARVTTDGSGLTMYDAKGLIQGAHRVPNDTPQPATGSSPANGINSKPMQPPMSLKQI